MDSGVSFLRRPLLPHQEIGCEWMLRTLKDIHGVLLTDAPGLGKTASALATVARLNTGAPCLVLCPVNCVSEWCKEAKLTYHQGQADVRAYKNSKTFQNMQHNTIVIMAYTALLGPFGAWAKKCITTKADSSSIIRRVAHCDKRWNTFSSVRDQLDAFFEKFSKRFNKKDPSDESLACGQALYDNGAWGCIVLDEAQKVKSSATSTAKAVAMIQARYRIALSGTPVMNDVSELQNIMHYGLLYADVDITSILYKKCIFGRQKSDVCMEQPIPAAREFKVIISTEDFAWDRQLYFDVLARIRDNATELTESEFLVAGESDEQRKVRLQAVRSKFFNNAAALQMVALHSQVYLRSESSQVFTIQWTHRTHMTFPRWFRDRVVTFMLCMKRIARFLDKNVHRKICTAWATAETWPSPKLLAIYDIYKSMQQRDPQDKLIVTSSSRVFLENHVMPYFQERNVGAVLLCGATQVQKQRTMAMFEQNPRIRVMCAVKSVVGVGLNLQHISGTVILCEPGWNDATDLQAVARIDRTGQTRTPHIYRLLWANSVDTAMMELQAIKRRIADHAVNKHENVQVIKVLCKLMDMDPSTALQPRPMIDAPITYRQAFVAPTITLKKPAQKKQKINEI